MPVPRVRHETEVVQNLPPELVDAADTPERLEHADEEAFEFLVVCQANRRRIIASVVLDLREEVWGDGFLSPGGPEEVERLLSGVDLGGETVVDIGSGAGGIPILLAGRYGAARVIGLDVEATVVAHARAKVEGAGLRDRIEIRRVEPGPMPLCDASVDIVFSKDSIVHIPDKEALAADAFRVLKPGGWFVASDWLISHDGEPSPEMADYIASEDLDFGMASPARYRRALEAAGFVDVSLTNRNSWYRTVAREELVRLEGAGREAFLAVLGEAELDE